MNYSIKLDWPPTINSYFRDFVINGSARRALTKAGKEYRQHVASRCVKEGIADLRLRGRLKVKIFAYPGDERKRDLDNLLKSLLDALGTKMNKKKDVVLTACVYEDDSQIDDLHIVRLDKNKNDPHVLVVIEPVPEQQVSLLD